MQELQATCIANNNCENYGWTPSSACLGYKEGCNKVHVTASVINASSNSCTVVTDPYSFTKRGGDGCFPAGTKIKMHDGSEKNVEDLKKGDLVFHPTIEQGVHIDDLVVGPENKAILKISGAGMSIRVTQEHPMILSDGSFVAANKLQVGDVIQHYEKREVRIESLEMIEPAQMRSVYNVKLMLPDSFFRERKIVADGFVTGDFLIQSKLRKSDKRLVKSSH